MSPTPDPVADMVDVKEESEWHASLSTGATSLTDAPHLLEPLLTSIALDGKRKASEDPTSPAAPKRIKHSGSEEPTEQPTTNGDASEKPAESEQVNGSKPSDDGDETMNGDDTKPNGTLNGSAENGDGNDTADKDAAKTEDKDGAEADGDKKPATQPLKRIPFPEKVRNHSIQPLSQPFVSNNF